jgi:hypothetical protein
MGGTPMNGMCATPWSTRDVAVQLIFVAGGSLYAVVMLALVHPLLAAGFIFLWALFLLLNQYFICRDCMYYGTLCGSFGMGRFRLFTPSGKKYFDNITGYYTMTLFGLLLLYPLAFLWILRPAWLWTPVYVAILAAGLYAHQQLGCAKCDLAHCSFHPEHGKEGAPPHR